MTMKKRSIYDIDADILDCIDTETGEILDTERLDALNMERDDKIHGVGLAYKAEVDWCESVDKEIKRLMEEKKHSKARMDSLKSYLAANVKSKKKWVDLSISFRKSESVEITNENEIPDNFKIEQAPKIDKASLKQVLKLGSKVEGAQLIEHSNIQIR